MMFAYSAVNAVFLALVLLLVVQACRRRREILRSSTYRRATLIVLAVLFLDTLIFDNILIAIGIVDYDHTRTLGLRLGIAPIEDFAYSLAAGIGLPALWVLLTRRRGETMLDTPVDRPTRTRRKRRVDRS